MLKSYIWRIKYTLCITFCLLCYVHISEANCFTISVNTSQATITLSASVSPNSQKTERHDFIGHLHDILKGDDFEII